MAMKYGEQVNRKDVVKDIGLQKRVEKIPGKKIGREKEELKAMGPRGRMKS